MADARIVLVLSENWTLVSPRDLPALVRIAQQAEQAGVDTVMLSEHVLLGPDSSAAGLMGNPRDYAAPGNQDPATPWPDSIVLGSAIASATSSLRVALAAMRAAWTDTPAAFQGEHFRFRDAYLEPKPHRPGGPALWFGGQQLHEPLLRRLVTYGDGFHPFGSPTAEELEKLRQRLRDAGRDPHAMELVGGIRCRFPDERSTASIDEALEQVPAQLEAGYTAICFKPSMYTDDAGQVPALCRRVVERIAAM